MKFPGEASGIDTSSVRTRLENWMLSVGTKGSPANPRTKLARSRCFPAISMMSKPNGASQRPTMEQLAVKTSPSRKALSSVLPSNPSELQIGPETERHILHSWATVSFGADVQSLRFAMRLRRSSSNIYLTTVMVCLEQGSFQFRLQSRCKTPLEPGSPGCRLSLNGCARARSCAYDVENKRIGCWRRRKSGSDERCSTRDSTEHQSPPPATDSNNSREVRPLGAATTSVNSSRRPLGRCAE